MKNNNRFVYRFIQSMSTVSSQSSRDALTWRGYSTTNTVVRSLTRALLGCFQISKEQFDKSFGVADWWRSIGSEFEISGRSSVLWTDPVVYRFNCRVAWEAGCSYERKVTLGREIDALRLRSRVKNRNYLHCQANIVPRRFLLLASVSENRIIRLLHRRRRVISNWRVWRTPPVCRGMIVVWPSTRKDAVRRGIVTGQSRVTYCSIGRSCRTVNCRTELRELLEILC